jgi:hypothetical protein
MAIVGRSRTRFGGRRLGAAVNVPIVESVIIVSAFAPVIESVIVVPVSVPIVGEALIGRERGDIRHRAAVDELHDDEDAGLPLARS